MNGPLRSTDKTFRLLRQICFNGGIKLKKPQMAQKRPQNTFQKTSIEIKRLQKTSKDFKTHQNTSKENNTHQKSLKAVKRHQKKSKDGKRRQKMSIHQNEEKHGHPNEVHTRRKVQKNIQINETNMLQRWHRRCLTS